MTSLMLHCGAGLVDRSALAEVATPEATRTWQPIPHYRLLRRVEEALVGVGLTVTQQRHALSHDGARYFGLLDVRGESQARDYGWMLGLRNSHDQTLPAGLVAGTRVFVCDNLAFSGEVRISRKHTRYIERDLATLTAHAVGKLGQLWATEETRIRRYQETELVPRALHDLVVRALDAGVVCGSQVPKVLAEFRAPSHEDFLPTTVWSLQNAFTEILKAGSVFELPKRTTVLCALLDTFCGVGRN